MGQVNQVLMVVGLKHGSLVCGVQLTEPLLSILNVLLLKYILQVNILL